MFEELVGEEDAQREGGRALCGSGAGRTRGSPDDDPPGLPLCCYALTAVSIRIHTPTSPPRSSAHSRIALRLPPERAAGHTSAGRGSRSGASTPRAQRRGRRKLLPPARRPSVRRRHQDAPMSASTTSTSATRAANGLDLFSWTRRLHGTGGTSVNHLAIVASCSTCLWSTGRSVGFEAPAPLATVQIRPDCEDPAITLGHSESPPSSAGATR
jgi:hypothetical protein